MRRMLITAALAAGLLTVGAFAPAGSGSPEVSQTAFQVETAMDPYLSNVVLTEPVVGRGNFVGVTWRSGDPQRVEIRSYEDGAWSEWTDMISDSDHTPDDDTAETIDQRGGTDPILLSDPEAVQVRITGEEPRGIEISFIDIKASKSVLNVASATAGLAIQPRSSWDPGNACAPREVPEEIQVDVAFVHHTGIRNTYSQSAVPGIILSYCLYHQNGRGWNDLAYNFMIDRFGTIWEGRAGGIDKGIRGGHTKGVNNYSTGIALIGNYTAQAPSSAQVQALEDLLSWKLGIHNVDPLATVDVITEGSYKFDENERVTFNTIAGHRDAQATACPGTYLYKLLPQIRSDVARGFRTASLETYAPVVPGDFNGDGIEDGAAFRAETGTWAVTNGVNGDTLAWSGAPTSDRFLDATPTDINGDGRTDIVAAGVGRVVELVSTGSGFTSSAVSFSGTPQMVLRVQTASGERTAIVTTNGSVLVSPTYSTVGSVASPVDATAGDLDGDGVDEIVVLGAGGQLSIVSPDGTSGVDGATLMLSGVDRVVAADFQGSGKDSIASVNPATGMAYLVRQSGSNLIKVASVDLETLDHLGDVFAAEMGGRTRLIALDAYVGEWKAVRFDERRPYFTLLEDQTYRTMVRRRAPVSSSSFLSWYEREFKWLQSTFGYGQDSDTNATTGVSGASRYTTNVEVSRMAYDRVDEVIIATSTRFPDALAAGAVAAKLDAALLLTDPGYLPSQIAAEITRLGASTVTIVGGTAAISDTVAQSVAALGVEVRRIGGADRYETAAQLSSEFFDAATDTVYIATGLNFPDALAAVPAAGRRGAPILLVSDSVPASVARELERIRPSRVFILGGPAAVGEGVEAEIQSITGVTPTRLGGANRYGTAVLVSKDAFGPEVTTVFVAPGTNYIDALIAGPVAHKLGGAVLLTTDTVPNGVDKEVARLRPDRVVLVGGADQHDVARGFDGIGPSTKTETLATMHRP